MENLIKKLKEAATAYYNGEEIMSNYEYDKLYVQLVQMEQETGIVLPDSPTQTVGAVVAESLPKDRHEYPALSLAKTKDIDDFVQTFKDGSTKAKQAGYQGQNQAVVMWKLDGSTIQLTYNDGKLIKAVTRGNGEIGSVITHNAPHINGIPMEIPYKGKAVFRGEALMSYAEFNRINENLPEDEKYKNPRNLANATISLLDSREMQKRRIDFMAFNLVYLEDMPDLFHDRLEKMKGFGLQVVPYVLCNLSEGTDSYLPDIMKEFENQVASGDYSYPVDGLVCALDEADYADTLPGTGHNPNILRGYAFKWADETEETILKDIEWSASRTGLLNPVAIFEPVEMEGTTVSRASLHNVSYILDKDLKIGDRITVYKANKIIPQVAENLDMHSGEYEFPISEHVRIQHHIPDYCPVCNGNVELSGLVNGSTVAICPNKNCPAKMVGKFVHFVERDCMNIVGMSEETVEKFVSRGLIREYADFWHLDRFKHEIIAMEGLGDKSYKKLIEAAENARQTDFVSFIHALGIPNVGKGQAKLLQKYYDGDIHAFLTSYAQDDLTQIDGIGNVISDSIRAYFDKEIPSGFSDSVDTEFGRLLRELHFADKTPVESNNILAGQTFVITGEVHFFKNRADLQSKIESLGGKAAGSVSKNTAYLINNDVASTSGKNKKAKELGIPIISEEVFLKMIGE